MDYTISTTIDGKKWHENLLRSSYATFFQTAEYLIPTKNRFPVFIYIFDDEVIVGQLGLSIVKKRKGSSGTLFSKFTELGSRLGNRGSWVSGPIIHSSDEKYRIKILQTLMKALDEVANTFDLMIIDGYSPPQDMLIDDRYKNIFKKYNYEVKDFITLISHLNQSIEHLWEKVKKNAKNDVTKAKRQNIFVREVSDKEELIKYKKLTKTWASTKGMIIKDPIENIEQDLFYCESGIQKFFLAYENDQIVAGLRIGCFNEIAYTHQVVNSYSKVGSVAGPLLTWTAIEWAKNSNLKIYDFSGGESPPENSVNNAQYREKWENLFAYKRKWGGIETPYFHFLKITHKKKYKIFRLLSKPDYIIRNYRKKHYNRIKKST